MTNFLPGSYKQVKSFAMPSNEEDRRGTSDNDTVREGGGLIMSE